MKFKTQQPSRVPKFSILIWVLSLLVMLSVSLYPESKESIYSFAIRPSQFLDLIIISKIYIFELFSSLMIHANWGHWFGNMIAFAIIAPALERRLGGLWFVLMFFISGVLGNIYSVYHLHDSADVLVGASGAVSALLGAWLMLFPRHQISIVIPIGLYLQRAKIPIVIVIFFWLALQFLFQYLGSTHQPVVWGAHIVGFISGLMLSFIYRFTH